ncbi:MAG: manganese oxidase [Blastocatellia bacterium]
MTTGRPILLRLLLSLIAMLIVLAASGSVIAQEAGVTGQQVQPAGASAPLAATEDHPAASAEKSSAAPASASAAPVSKAGSPAQPLPTCTRTISANVVAIAQPYMLNRLGTAMPSAVIFALQSDVDATSKTLKDYKRARPLVLRANMGDCLDITLFNWISATSTSPSTRQVSVHVQGMQLVNTADKQDCTVVDASNNTVRTVPCSTTNDGSFAGANNSGLVNPGESRIYHLYAAKEGTFLLYSLGDVNTSGDQFELGLFGAVNVQPAGAEWYRSQVTQADLQMAIDRNKGNNGFTPGGQPVLNYDAVYPPGNAQQGPILKMLDANNRIAHSDLTAVITGPQHGRFPGANGDPNKDDPPCSPTTDPRFAMFCKNDLLPDRKQPYREITTIYHEVFNPAVQAFPVQNGKATPNIQSTVIAGQDGFAINYGTGGIAAEIYANRIKVGPMADCVTCKYEEFFLSAWTVGDPAMVVDVPANYVPPPPPPPCTPQTLNSSSTPCTPTTTKDPPAGFKATKAFYPDDPSNVFHSYLNDHVKFRIMHGGMGVTHVHHQHAQQWLASPNSQESNYLDSQMITPGASYTLEMVYNGSGNLNKTVGDSIFHCHFYPHFAGGMWAMWRVHDVFESGTLLNNNGQPQSGAGVWNRALPDGEIKTGTPIPALVPMPTIAMAPMPARVKVCPTDSSYSPSQTVGTECPALIGTPIGTMAVINKDDFDKGLPSGYPFYIPGIAGTRAPHPPFDFAPDSGFTPGTNPIVMDGGLPRHIVVGGQVVNQQETQFDWSKDFYIDCADPLKAPYYAVCKTPTKNTDHHGYLNAVQLPEEGTAAENAAMKYYSTRQHPSYTQGNTPASFLVNGLPRKPSAGYTAVNAYGSQRGAPFADPGVNLNGSVAGGKTPRIYKGAAFQMDVTLNTQGWHYPQQRILGLWKDVVPTLNKQRTPEPLFMRTNSGEVIEFWHTNLVPNYYQVDDFQVRTPTDIIGQHIHLVKFDVMTADGAANGFNYEDGTFSPDEVREIIHAVNNTGGTWNGQRGTLVAKPPPAGIIDCSNSANAALCKEWTGAQTTIQRWYAEPLPDNSSMERTLGTVFTHDHFGPSTHQQAGLYGGLLAEPAGSTWQSLDGKVTFGNRDDGGPTSWQANILTPNKADSYREFALEFQDFQLAYAKGGTGLPPTYPSPDPATGFRLVNTYGNKYWDNVLDGKPDGKIDASNSVTPPTPQLISASFDVPVLVGTMSLNYQQAPISFRMNLAQDLSYSFLSAKAPQVPYANGDPSTPLLRAYKNDRVRVRTLVGAHELAAFFNIRGMKWLSEYAWTNSGYKSSQGMGLSEYFHMDFKAPPSSVQMVTPCPDTPNDATSSCAVADYLYVANSGDMGLANGLWGIFRAYDPTKPALNLAPLPNNQVSASSKTNYTTCPSNQPAAKVRNFNITAITTQQALADIGGALPLNYYRLLGNSQGIMYVRSEDLVNGKLNCKKDADGRPVCNAPLEPIVLRAAAGDCINVTLTNGISPNATVLTQKYTLQPPFDVAPYNNLSPSKKVGLHPELLAYDVTTSDGINVGYNTSANQVASIGSSTQQAGSVAFFDVIQKKNIYVTPVRYQWYAGAIDRDSNGNLKYTSMELGAASLFPSDPLLQHINGLYGAVIVEPANSTWTCDGPPDPKTGYPTQVDCWPPTAPVNPQIMSRASATVSGAGQSAFRDFAVMMTEDLKMNGSGNSQVEISGVNYGTEPTYMRFGKPNPGQFATIGKKSAPVDCTVSNTLPLAGTPSTPSILMGDPKTPIFTALAGTPTRLRMLHSPGTGIAQVFTLSGHVWQKTPYVNNSTGIGSNPLSQWIGSIDNFGSTTHFDVLLDKAGGENQVPGDYLYTVFVPSKAQYGLWGVFRVRTTDGYVVTGKPPISPVKNLCWPGTIPSAEPPHGGKPDGLERFRPKPGAKEQ